MTDRRRISTRERARLFALHGGTCHLCGLKIDGTRDRWEISHEIPLEMLGADDDENRLLAHAKCHRAHTATVDIPQIAKAKRVESKHNGAYRSRNPMPGGRSSKWRKRMDGTVERR